MARSFGLIKYLYTQYRAGSDYMQKKALVGMILVLVALIMIGISLAMPWYSAELTVKGYGEPDTTSLDYYFDHRDINWMNKTTSYSYDEEGIQNLTFVSTFETTQMLVYLGLLGCVIGIIGASIVMQGKMNQKIGALLILVAVIFSLIAPLYLMSSLPGAFNEDFGDDESFPDNMGTDFFGSQKYESDLPFSNATYEATWGGSTGWFLPIIAMALCVIALILVATSKPAIVPFAVEQPLPAAMAAQPATHVTFQTEAQAPPTTIAPPAGAQPGEQFQCPECSKIFIVKPTKRPLHIRCPYCGLEGIVE